MDAPQRNGKKMLLLLLLVFTLPVAAAKLVLSYNLYEGGATNKGQLLAANLSYQLISMPNPKPHEWQLLYLLPQQCDSVCQDRLYIIQQSHTALGQNQKRVKPIIMVQEGSDIAALHGFDFDTSMTTPSMSKLLDKNALIIVDPLGHFVMRYAQIIGHSEQIMQGKELVGDLRKLLKLSRVG